MYLCKLLNNKVKRCSKNINVIWDNDIIRYRSCIILYTTGFKTCRYLYKMIRRIYFITANHFI